MRTKRIYTILLSSIFMLIVATGCDSNKKYLDDYNDSQPQNESETYASDPYTFLGMSSRTIASAEKGLYYMVSNPSTRSYKICYYDYNTKESAIWCNKLACEHNDAECTGFLDISSQNEFIEYYNQKVYKNTFDDAGTYLEQFGEDGSNQIRLINLVPSGVEITKLNAGKFFDNHYYYTIRNNQNQLLFYSVELKKDAIPQQLFTLDINDNSRISPTSIFINQDGIYVSESSMISDATVRTIYNFNFISKKLDKFVTGGSDLRMCVNDNLYYRNEGKILYRVDANGTAFAIENADIAKLDSNYGLYCNENYIVFDNFLTSPRKIYVYNIAENILKEFNVEELEDKYGKKKTDVTVIGAPGGISAYDFFNHYLGLPIGVDGNHYYIENTDVSDRDIISIKLNSYSKNEMTYSIIESNLEEN